MSRTEMLATLGEHDDLTLETLVALAPALADLRLGSVMAVKHFADYHNVGLTANLVVQSRPGRRERERVEIRLVTGDAVQLALDFSLARSA